MRRTLIRASSVGAVAALVMAVVAGSAFAAPRHGKFGVRGGVHGFRAGGFGAGPGGMGFGQFGGGGPGGPGGGGVLISDVLTPSASFLNISVSVLTTDLAGGKTLAQEATAKGKTADDLITAIMADEKTNLDNEKAAGWITADQETKLLSVLTVQVTALVNNGPPVPRGDDKGDGGPLQLAATFLGVSVSDLETALKGGKTLADVATAQGKTAADLVTALEAPVKAKLDQAVTDGKITPAQETAILADLTTHLTNFVNGTKPTNAQMNSVSKALLKYSKRFAKRH
jgi:hypothetical protein